MQNYHRIITPDRRKATLYRIGKQVGVWGAVFYKRLRGITAQFLEISYKVGLVGISAFG